MDNRSSVREEPKGRGRPRDDDGNTEGPKPKRSRVSRACDQCRSSRDRCDGNAPCESCTTSGRQCTYTTAPKKRGIQPGYIRALELSLATVLAKDPSSRRHLVNQLTGSGSLRQHIASKGDSTAEELLTAWTSSTINQQIDALLSGSPEVDLGATDSEQNDSLEPLAESQAATHRGCGLEQQRQISQQNVPQPSGGDSLQPLTDSHPKASDYPELPNAFWEMFDHYFTFTHNWLPMADKNAVLKAAYSYSASSGHVSQPQITAANAELWALVALASHGRDTWRQYTRPAVNAARMFLGSLGTTKPDPTYIRAHIMLALVSLGTGDILRAWLDIGIAVRLMVYWFWDSITAFTVPDYLRLALSLFVVEAIVAVHIRHPPHLSVQKFPQFRFGRLPEDDTDEWSPWRIPSGNHTSHMQDSPNLRRPGKCISTFNNLVTLTTLTDASDPPALSTIPDMAIYTPQRIHYEMVLHWFKYVKSDMSFAEYSHHMLQLLYSFQAYGGPPAVPPTLLPLIRDILSSQNIRDPSMASSPVLAFAAEVVQRWDPRPSEPIPFASNDVTAVFEVPSIPRPIQTQQQPQNHLRPHRQSISAVIPSQASWPVLDPSLAVAPSTPPTIEAPAKDNAQTNPLLAPTYPAALDTPSDGGLNSDFHAIFDEFAQLDGSRQANDGSQFMQNLGLGPDLDLRAFFGADYQESDPLLTYLNFDRTMQPGDPSNFPT